MSCAAALAAPAAVAQEVPPVPPVPPGPSLHLVSAELRQVGGDLAFGLRFDRFLPVDELDPSAGRVVCVVLSPAEPSRRRVCVTRRDGRLSAALASIDATGLPIGPTRVLSGARLAVKGDFLRLRASAGALHVTLGRQLTWRAVVTWRDGPCEIEPDPLACVQTLPESGAESLATTAPPRPAFAGGGGLRVLATGDSMIQILDEYLTLRLGGRPATTVRSDARVGTGVSKLALLDWIRTARSQARDFKPDVTVVFLGANDGFPMTTAAGRRVECCGGGWVGEYARRVASMMRAYVRGGRSLVYWLTLPAPRRRDFARVYRAANAAIGRAAAAVGEGARVIDLVPVFTPGEHFRRTITFRGQTVTARQDDGVHLSNAGASVAATLVVDRLRADRALPRTR